MPRCVRRFHETESRNISSPLCQINQSVDQQQMLTQNNQQRPTIDYSSMTSVNQFQLLQNVNNLSQYREKNLFASKPKKMLKQKRITMIVWFDFPSTEKLIKLCFRFDSTKKCFYLTKTQNEKNLFYVRPERFKDWMKWLIIRHKDRVCRP